MSNAWNKYDGLACSDRHGYVAIEERPYVEPEILCPQMTVNRKPVPHKTMTLAQCLNRIKVRNPCTIGCLVLDALRALE